MTRRPHPFRELRDREHIAFELNEVADCTGGAFLAVDGDQAAIVISPSLGRKQRSDALAHELEHDAMGVVAPPATEATMERIEHMVDQRVTAWLIPADELRAFVEAHEREGNGVDAPMVAEHFDSTVERAQAGLEQLQVARRYEAALVEARPPESTSGTGEPWA